jgi:hypothetical protein
MPKRKRNKPKQRLTCPFCERKLTSSRGLTTHMSKCKDRELTNKPVRPITGKVITINIEPNGEVRLMVE